ncbi:hypothetical protein [Thiosocius teredinicola]|uniref:hypothetical protein n=1 Tax=Thiosocius teredinicola TaxID=1973002 RepID=UPI000F770E73
MIVTPTKEYDSEGSRIRLTLGKEYEVLAIEAGFYRVLTDPELIPYGNDPVLYEASCFNVNDGEEPSFWVTETHEGETYRGPFVWLRYFFEELHDGNAKAREEFKCQLKKYYPRTWRERYGS